jgi:spermidine synthase
MLSLYTVTIFVSAGLLFLVQPMFARMVLPLLGGAPAVWNTAMVFFQATLLAGYAYAHWTTARLGVRRQAALHLGLLLLPLAILPIAVPTGWSPPAQTSPIPWLLALLAVSVGLPFFVVSTSAPILQAWFAGTGHRHARDPYFLYAASNLGSMLALLGYPVVVERALSLHGQSRAWALGYIVLALLIAGCAVALWRAPAVAARGEEPGLVGEPIGARRRARWVLLSFVPSSLLLSVTTYLSTDIAAIPLLWVVPLALYLLTFILVFARRPPLPHRLVVEILPLAMLPLVLILVARANEPLVLIVPTHLLVFLVTALACHGELARDRPAPARLTEYYLWMSAGGVLGGAFTALLAPLLFRSVAEYPLMLVLACLAARRASAATTLEARVLDLVLPAGLGLVALGLIHGVQSGALGLEAPAIGPVFGGLVLLSLTFARRPLRFGLGIGALLLAATTYQGAEGRLLHAERSFFGVSRVTRDPSERFQVLLHGTTLHGMQSLDLGRRLEPLTYFERTGPLGQLFAALGGGPLTRRVAVVGLGAGSLACHGRPDERWTFYEIDPVVERIARDPRFFTFLRDCAPTLDVVMGDARLSLRAAPDGEYGLIVLDAYSSDAPPMHLITREAVLLYRAKLAPGGLLVFNVSNRHLELEPVLGTLARATGLVALAQDDAVVHERAWQEGKRPSQWVVMARHLADLGPLARDGRWHPAAAPPGAAPWTDDFNSLLSAFRWH